MNIFLFLIIIAIIVILLWLYFTGQDESSSLTGKLDDHAPEKTLRRRSLDKQIEEEKSDHHRRSTDAQPDEGKDDTDSPFKLPYLTDEIIPADSRFRIYRRTLLNSEVYANKSHFSTAISLYEGVASRINDVITKNKIKENTEYLKNYLKHKDELKARDGKDLAEETATTGNLKFSIDGPSQRRINIEVIDNDTTQTIERITGKIRDEFKEELKKIKESSKSAEEKDKTGITENFDNIRDTMENLSKDKVEIENKLKKLNEFQLPGEELSALKNKIEALEENVGTMDDMRLKSDILPDHSEIDRLKDEIGKIKDKLHPADKKRSGISGDAVELHQLTDTLDKLDNRLDSIQPSAKKQEAGGYPPPDSKKETDKDSPVTDQKPVEQVPAKLPSEEKSVVKKEKIEEDEDDFDLVSDYMKEKDEDELSDEEIFAKILKEDKKKKSEEDDSFEILGDRRDEEGELDVLSKEEDQKRKEEENFYRNFVKTNRKKKRELPILKVNYDFAKLPDQFSLSKEQNILEYSFYKYKPMLEKAGELIKKRKVREAIDYYKVVIGQNIPPELKKMIRSNINDLAEYLEKYLTAD